MLNVTQRQRYLKELGFYEGKVDGLNGPLTKKAVLNLQKTYFVRTKDRDGLYGPNTDKLLVNVYNIKKYTKNFRISEFKCGCGGKHCTGYPEYINVQLLINLQKFRDKYGSVTITSGARCKKFNNSLVGSSKNSRHMTGKAADFRVSKSNTVAGRREIMSYGKKLTGYHYTYANINGSHPNMGRAIHFDVN